MVGLIVFALIVVALLWAFWPQISHAMRITANEGDDLVAGLNKAKREVKKDIKAVNRKLTR
jgi:hypothetical protein